MGRLMRNGSAKVALALTCSAALLLFTLAGAAPAFAQGGVGWELWPRGRSFSPPQPTPPPEPAAQPPAEQPAAPAPAEGAAEKAGEAAGGKVAAGITAGTVGKAAAILAGIALIAVAAGGGGGGGGTTTSHH